MVRLEVGQVEAEVAARYRFGMDGHARMVAG